MIKVQKLTLGELVGLVLSALAFAGITGSTFLAAADSVLIFLLLAATIAATVALTLVASKIIQSSSFPNITTLIETTIEFKLDTKVGGIRPHALKEPTPSGYLRRITHFRPRQRNIAKFDRFHFVNDDAEMNGGEVLSHYEHSATIECFPHMRNDTGKISETAIISPALSNFRKLVIDLSPSQPGMFDSFKRFRITEAIRLPNEFDMLDEFYDVQTPEPVNRRTFRFEFVGIDVENFKVQQRIGTRRDPLLAIQPDTSSSGRIVFTHEITRPVIGASFRFSWKYKNPIWTVRERTVGNQEL